MRYGQLETLGEPCREPIDCNSDSNFSYVYDDTFYHTLDKLFFRNAPDRTDNIVEHLIIPVSIKLQDIRKPRLVRQLAPERLSDDLLDFMSGKP